MAENNNGNWWDQSGQPQGDPRATPAADASTNTSANDTPTTAMPTGQQNGDSASNSDNAAQGDQSAQTSGDQPTETIPTASPSSSPSDSSANSSASNAGSTNDANVANDQPDYKAAPHETYTTQYRPAPQYGAYGPSPTQQDQSNGQSGQSNGQNQQNQQMPPQGNQNPYYNNNPFMPNGQNNGQNGGQPGNGQGNQNPYAPQGPNGPQGPNNNQNSGKGGKPRKHGNTAVIHGVIIAVVAAVVAAALCLGIGYCAITRGWVTIPTSSSLADIDSNDSGSGSVTVDGDSVDWVSVAASVSDSVVSIQTTVEGGTAAGSGAILDTEGHIVTNNHVISDAQSIQVTLSNGQIYTAEVVGTDTTTDLAVIQLDDAPDDLTPVEFADSDELAVGEAVMAIGNPLGYDDTATTGIVSALNRPVSVVDDDNSEVVTNAVQIDAAINPGNSGGPTFNAAGQVIGINSSIASTASSSDEAGSIGIGFAIPSNLVERVANEIIEDGEATHVALGVTITSTTVEADGVTRGGARITTPSSGGSAVVSGSPADEAGLRAEDTIVAYNGNAVTNNYSLLGYVRAAALGDTVTLTIVRSGETMDVEVTLDQEEADVNGTTTDEDDSDSDSDSQQQDDGSGSDDGDGYGFYDPFGLW